MENGRGINATSTGNENLTFVFRIEVDKVFATHETSLHTKSTRKSCLLVAREYTFNGAVLNIVGVENGKFYGITNAVVGTERSTLGAHPVTVNIALNGIVVEVYVHIHQFVAHHIHMTLKNCGSTILIAFGGGLLDKNVSGFVYFCLQSVVLAKLL